MRLTCPNCGAQYEVDGSMIPDDGRDVQCSACGNTWFQLPEGAEAPERHEAPDEAPAEAELAAEAEAEAEAEEIVEHEEAATEDIPAEDTLAGEPAEERAEEDLSAEPVPPADADLGEEAEAEEAVGEAEAEAEEPPLPAARPSERLDENSLALLREEAEREAEARRAEQAQTLETQPELGLTEGDETPDRRGVRAHVARMRGETAEGDEDDVLPGSRGDLLPDIEEINSTLRPASEHPETAEVVDPMVVEAEQRRGFRWGFTLMIVIAALLVLTYVFSPQIAQEVPALEPAVVEYVDVVNGLRDATESLLTRTTESLSGVTGGDSSE